MGSYSNHLSKSYKRLGELSDYPWDSWLWVCLWLLWESLGHFQTLNRLIRKVSFPMLFLFEHWSFLDLCPWQVIFFVTFTFVMALTSRGLRQRFASGHPWDCSTPYCVLSTASPLPLMLLLQEPDSTRTFWLWLPSTVRWPSDLHKHTWDWTCGWYFLKL